MNPLALRFLLLGAAMVACAVAGAISGMRYHAGQDAIAAQVASEHLASDRRQQRQISDQSVTRFHREVLATQQQLGAAHAQISTLPLHTCLDADLVGLLNAIGGEPVRAAAAVAAGAPAAPATDLRHGIGIGNGVTAGSTDRDVATAIAQCRAAYATTASQLNAILDIEAQRHPELPAAHESASIETTP